MDIAVAAEIRGLPALTVTATMERVRRYAELANDFNPIHIDPVFAAASPMGGCIAHGTLSLNLLLQAVQEAFGERAGEVDVDIRFVRPVRVDQSVVTGGEPLDDGRRGFRIWVRDGEGEPVIEGTATLSA